MWTPRRILLFLLGLSAFASAYAGYAYALGGIDGLPPLPEKYLQKATDSVFDIPSVPVSPTLQKLDIAFRPFNAACPESTDSTTYQIRLEIPQGDDSRILLASGPLEISKDQPRRVTLSPFSVAIFGKPRPANERGPGETASVQTIHADRAVLEFDKPIQSPQDMGRSRLIGMELIADPDVLSHDPRRGRILMTTNQRQSDPGQWVVMRTIGPVYYSAPPHPNKPVPPEVPQIRTTAYVEVENRANMPKPLRGQKLQTAPVRVDDLRGTRGVMEMAFGLRTPPPTVTAEGMKIYLENNTAKNVPGKPNKQAIQTGFTGIRRMELLERVQFNLWSGTEVSKSTTPTVEPNGALLATVGSAMEGAQWATRLQATTLTSVETLGPFSYDVATNIARFRIAPHANPNVSNYVMVNKFTPVGSVDSLLSDQLDIEFAGALLTSNDKPNPKQTSNSTSGIKSLTATGRQVVTSVEADQFTAQGTELNYTINPKTGVSTTVLKGTPVTAIRDRNKLIAGTPANPSTLTMTSTPGKPGTKEPATTALVINGPGRIDLFETGQAQAAFLAEWAESLTFDKQESGGRLLDRFTFKRGSFQDTKGAFGIGGDTLQLWLEPNSNTNKDINDKGNTSPRPARLLAVGHVKGGSDEFIIKETDSLNIWFTERAPVAPVVVAANPMAPVPMVPNGQKPAPAAAPPIKPKAPPVHMAARTIDAWMARTTNPATKGTSYALEKALCIDKVKVTQASAEPNKYPVGLDVSAAKMNLTTGTNPAGVSLGYKVEVEGTKETLAEVHYERISLLGPVVVIDQPRNEAHVMGRGKLLMPTGGEWTNPNPNEVVVKQPVANENPTMLEVLWSDEMHFIGADGTAKFLGKVQALQDNPFPKVLEKGKPATATKSWVVGHALDVRFDKPVYFNAARKPASKPEESPKLTSVVCTPMSDDELQKLGRPLGDRVTFSEETMNRDGTVASAQRMVAQVLEFRGRERESIIHATGPGELRILRPGAKDPAKSDPVAAPTAKPAVTETEMKLTIITFKSRLQMNDQGKKFQKATFLDGVQVLHVPGADINMNVVPHAMPARGLSLTCQDSLVVTTYAKDGLTTEQNMEAIGNAEVKTDEYLGRAFKITFDGKLVELVGNPPRLAHLYKNVAQGDGRDTLSGQKIIYDRASKDERQRVKIVGWADGTYGR